MCLSAILLVQPFVSVRRNEVKLILRHVFPFTMTPVTPFLSSPPNVCAGHDSETLTPGRVDGHLKRPPSTFDVGELCIQSAGSVGSAVTY